MLLFGFILFDPTILIKKIDILIYNIDKYCDTVRVCKRISEIINTPFYQGFAYWNILN